MKKIALTGTAVAAIALSAGAAHAIPPNSPYAIWAPHAIDRGVARAYIPDRAGPWNPVAFLIVGRAAYVPPGAPPELYPHSWELTTAENIPYYSRGR